MEDDLDIALSILSLDDPETVNQALQTIGTLDPARAQQLQGRLQLRSQALSLLQGGDRTVESETSRLQEQGAARGAALDQLAQNPVLNAIGSAIGDFGRAVANNPVVQEVVDFVPNRVNDLVNLPTQLDQFAQDIFNPEAALQNALAQQSQTQADSLAFESGINPSSGLEGFPAVTNPNALAPTQTLNPNQVAAYQQFAALQQQAQSEQQFSQAEAARNALLVDAASQQGASIVNQENLRRLGEQLALQQVPQVATNSLNNAAAFAQQPQIGSAPANVTQSLALTQALAPQTQVPSLQPAARTNIAQRQRANNIDQNAQANLQRQQIKALELAMKQFQTQIARPILSERR